MLGCSFNPVRREDNDIVSVGRDASVCADATDDALDFLMIRGSLKILELLDVEEKTLDVSLTSFDPDRVRPPPGLRNRPAMPEATELRDCTEGERGTVTTKLEEGRELTDTSAKHTYIRACTVRHIKVTYVFYYFRFHVLGVG